MNQPNFTPGPWNAEQDGTSFLVKTEDDLIIAGTFGFGAPDREGQEEANARLMAAAPALYERVSFMRDVLDRHLVNQDYDLLREDLDDMDEAVRAALALVEDES